MEGLVYKGDLLSEEATVMSMVDELMRQEYFVVPTCQLQVWFWFLESSGLHP